MDAPVAEGFRRRLLTMRADLDAAAEASREATRTVVLDQASVGRLSRIDALQGQQMALEGARRREQMLVRIEAALKRIETETFGDCFVCGEEIDARRLSVDPTITRCLRCAEA
jgi:DnaK suppressor protein